MLRSRLEEIGLSPKEALVYEALAIHGASSANELAKRTSTNRTVTYNVLQSLVGKGVVSHVKRETKRVYTIAAPESILATLQERETIAQELVKDIRKLRPTQSSQHSVTVLEGVSGLRSVFEELRHAKDLRVLNATGNVFSYLHGATHLVRDMERNKPRLIATSAMRSTPLSKFKGNRTRYLPKGEQNFATTFIFGSTVIIIVLKEKPFITRIVHQDIAAGYRQDFDVLWNRL
jgi:sugar-specific transcriptional regulator TrmB